MKKWRCTVCNYIHSGETPPEVCPVCGADKSKFVEISNDEAIQYEKGNVRKNAAAGEAALGAEQTETVTVKRPANSPETGAAPGGGSSSGSGGPPPRQKSFLNHMLLVHHAHPMTVHVPNGVLPIVVLFMFIAAIFGSKALAWSAFYFTLMVVISMPVVMYTGYNEWLWKYNGAKNTLFMMKIAAAIVVAVTSLLIVIWFFLNPDVIYAGAARRGSFLVLNVIMLVATGVAGFIGGKLVFKD